MPDSPPSPDQLPLDASSQALSEALRSSFAVVKVLMAVLLVVFLASGVFTVGPQENAIVLRMGKPLGEGTKALLGPGLHFSWPYPIDECVKVPFTGSQRVRSTVGWYAITPEQEQLGAEPYAANSLNPAIDGYALTADGNIVHTRAELLYHVEDPISYVFSFVNASNAVQQALDEALIQTASRFKVDDILTQNITGFRDEVRRRVTQLLDEHKLGVVVEQCDVRSRAPLKLSEDFEKVLKAKITRDSVLNAARSEENKVLSAAQSQAKSRINLAESDRRRLVAEVSSRAEQFQDLLPKYRENPSLFVQQRLTETLGRVLTNVQEKVFVTDGGKMRELRLLLNREPPAPPKVPER